MRARTPGALAVGILLFPLIALAQAPPRDPSSTNAPTGTGRLRGRVVSADSGTPLRRAQVRATASALRNTRLTTTDADGRYQFDGLPAGRYSISVNKAGYVGLEFGQSRPFEGGRPLDLAEGQIAEQIDFALPRGSVIFGRITDEAGDPIVGANVQAMRYQYLPGGRRQLAPAGSQNYLSNRTNDLGEFRLYGLMPGTYVVSAHSGSTGIVSLNPQLPQAGDIGSVDIRDGFIQTYFPGTANLAEAQPVLVSLSEEAHASFPLATGRMSRISGVVHRSDGRPSTQSSVSLRPRESGLATMGGWGNSMIIAPDGSFSFANVPPGEFMLEVNPSRQFLASQGAAASRAGSEAPALLEFASVPVTVGGGDVAGLAITTRPGATVSGHVLVAGGMLPKSPGDALRVTATPEDTARGIIFLTSDNGQIDASGRFEIRGVTGRVFFRPSTLPNNLVLKSVTANRMDITDRPYDAANGDLSSVEIVIADQAQVNGTANNARGEPVRDFRVALFPARAKPSLLTARFMSTGSADPNGRFQILRLPAGEYLGVAVHSFERGQEWDPEFQQRVLPSARRFALKEGQSLTIELPYVE